ncbi:hypothetical protein IQ260_28370 [Leptolyngbya cf. ectocarpi LEGE 11479]|uniref:Uncharacterized protein n=1 Tax=Leptolyngbya cf. ectocarpi LEGE 11479 TaxID=1828722 RepID=A0A929A053_LEPEC|nr:hypothetical protein [Leptolyngbya ectocarpi]MBE9070563.1 hypothetical protein [Leptolyngbya cf. ectocarpi LEGE 11479]
MSSSVESKKSDVDALLLKQKGPAALPLTAHEKKSQLEALLAERKQELAERLKQLAEIQVSVQQLQGYVTSIEGVIEIIGAEIDADKALLTYKQNSRRNPTEMLRDEFKGMKLADIAETVLEDNAGPLTTTELSRIIYDAYNDDELNRARNSLSAELRAGIRSEHPRWQKLGRNAYASLEYSQEEAA